jgi:hypothetical protein
MAFNFPNSPSIGQLYPSPPQANVPVYQWDGEKWVVITSGVSPVYIGDAPPAVPSNGTLWFNSITAQLYIYYTDVNSSQWVMVVSAQAPSRLQKNYIINGAMMISQENGSTAGSAAAAFYPVDMFSAGAFNTTGVVNVQQAAAVTPGGSPNRFYAAVATADASVGATDLVYISHAIEGLRIADLKFGTANAKTLTLQFGVLSTLAGTYSIVFLNKTTNRSYVAEYTIAAGETSQDLVRSITIPGDVLGTWVTDNTQGLYIRWGLMVGTTYQQAAGSWGTGNVAGSPNQVNFLSSTSNVFHLFDVGLYEGSVAPPFVVPDYAGELLSCQRYYAVAEANTRFWATAANQISDTPIYYKVTMRISPGITSAAGSQGNVSGVVPNAVSANSGRFEITSAAAGDCYALNQVVKLNARL